MRGRRILAMFLSMAVCVSLCGCRETAPADQKEDTWVSEGKEMIGKEITSGEIVIDGKAYTFPMQVREFLDNGWYVSNKYENKDVFLLKPGSVSTEFELFNEKDESVKITISNDSKKAAKIEDCSVYYLRVKTADVHTVLPGGFNESSEYEDMVEAYGDPEETQEEGSGYKNLFYSFTDSNGRKCQVIIGIFDNETTMNPLTRIEYEFIE